MRARLAPRLPNTYKAVSSPGTSGSTYGALENFVAQSSDASRLLDEGISLPAFRRAARDRIPQRASRASARLESRRDHRVGLHGRGFAILDHFVLSPEHSRITNMVRFGMHVPAVILMLCCTSKRFYERWYDSGISFVAPMFGIGTVIMSAFSPPNEVPLVGGRLLLASLLLLFHDRPALRAAARANSSCSPRWSSRSSRAPCRTTRLAT
jgi:hypothetical protein